MGKGEQDETQDAAKARWSRRHVTGKEPGGATQTRLASRLLRFRMQEQNSDLFGVEPRWQHSKSASALADPSS